MSAFRAEWKVVPDLDGINPFTKKVHSLSFFYINDTHLLTSHILIILKCMGLELQCLGEISCCKSEEIN